MFSIYISLFIIFLNASVIPFICMNVPKPKIAANIPKVAYSFARNLNFLGIHLSIYTCGPPLSFDLYFVARYASVYLSGSPIKTVIMSQIKAPGPPIVTAVATPTMFPEPRVAESDMHTAWNVDILLSLFSFLNKIKRASFNFVI